VKIFYIRRALRIFPLYFGFLILYSLLGSVPSWQYWVYLQNVANAWRVPMVGPGHFWSLAVEEQFYLVWPFLVLFSPRRWLVPILWIMILASAGLRFFLAPRHVGVFTLTFTRLDGLAAGALLAVAYGRNALEPHRRLLQTGLVVFAVPMAVMGMVFRNEGTTWFAVVKYLIIAGFYSCVVGTQLVGSDSPASKFLRARWLRFIGRISYGLYVFHPAVFVVCLTRLAGFSEWVQAITAIMATFAISVASWYGFERHFIKLKVRWAPERKSAPHAPVEI
jgi:peptidoglycan/LPS O-acetylase OafA/YrhL